MADTNNGTSDVIATSEISADVDFESGSAPHDGNSSVYKFVWGSVVSLNYRLVPMVLVAIVLFVVIVATAFGNFLVGLSLFRYRSLRTISNYLIGNLALSDFLLATTVLPVSIFNECLGHWIFGEAACNAWLTMDVLYCTASLWNLCVIGFDRFTATLYPMWYRNNLSAKQAGKYVAFVWAIAAVICVPPVLGWNSKASNYVYNNETMVYQCDLFKIPSYVLYSACGSFYIPLLITSFFYIRIFIALRQRMMKNQRKTTAGAVAMAAKNVQQASVGVSEAAKSPPKAGLGKNLAQKQKKLFGGNSDSDLNEESEDLSTAFTRATTSCTGITCVTSSTTGLTDATPVQSPSNDRMLCDTPTETLTAISTIDGSFESNGPARVTFDISQNESLKKTNSNKALDCTDSDFHQIRPLSNLSPDYSLDSKLNLDASSSNPSYSKPQENHTSGGSMINRKVAAVAKSFTSAQSRKKHGAHPTIQKSSSSANQRRYEQRELRATMRMGIIIAFFCGMWIGFFTVYVLKSWCPDSCPVPRSLDAFFFWLGYSNSSVNPILYTIFNDEFRRAFMKILGCYKKLGGLEGGRGRDGMRSMR